MPVLYFAKVNINSNIYDIYRKDKTIEQIMRELYKGLNDNEEYIKIDKRIFADDDGELNEVELREVYNFSELNKYEDETKLYVTGKIVRRYPIWSEKFDEELRTSVPIVYRDNSISTLFYFDLRSEVIVFSERRSFGYKQIVEAFQELFNQIHTSIGYEVVLLKDPFTIKERLKRAHKITKINLNFESPS